MGRISSLFSSCLPCVRPRQSQRNGSFANARVNQAGAAGPQTNGSRNSSTRTRTSSTSSTASNSTTASVATAKNARSNLTRNPSGVSTTSSQGSRSSQRHDSDQPTRCRRFMDRFFSCFKRSNRATDNSAPSPANPSPTNQGQPSNNIFSGVVSPSLEGEGEIKLVKQSDYVVPIAPDNRPENLQPSKDRGVRRFFLTPSEFEAKQADRPKPWYKKRPHCGRKDSYDSKELGSKAGSVLHLPEVQMSNVASNSGANNIRPRTGSTNSNTSSGSQGKSSSTASPKFK